MSDTYNLKEIAKILGLVSSHAARKRINSVRGLLERRELLVYIPGEGGALGVAPEGLELLKRLNEIGREGKTIEQAASALLIELGEAEPPADPKELRLFKVEVRQEIGAIKGEITELVERVEEIERKRPWWERLTRMLPRGE